MKTRHPSRAGNELGPLLRHWRKVRGKSQLDLSLDAGVSQRHISFVESGRSVPGRQTLMDLARALDVPLADRNALLLASGYAPMYPECAWDSPAMQSITRALQRMLRQHEPFPAVVMDRSWNVLMANDATPRFFGGFIDLARRAAPRNLLHLMFDPAGMRPFIANWDEVAPSLIWRVRREAVGGVVAGPTRELLAALLAYPGAVATEPAVDAPAGMTSGASLPIVPLSFVMDRERRHYFSMITTVGTPQTVAAQELRIECLFPADEATEVAHRDWMADPKPTER